jgi:hypothetical protein
LSSGRRSESQVSTGIAGCLGVTQGRAHGRSVGGGHCDAVDALGHEVGHNLHLLVTAAMLAGADIEAFERAIGLRLGLLAAVARLVEERIVGVLRHERKRQLVLRLRAERGPGQQCAGQNGGAHYIFQHFASSLF